MLEALIFDVDGTLADSEEAHRAAFNAAFADAAIDWYWDRGLYAQLLLITGGKERIRHYLRHLHPAPAPGSDDWIRCLHAHKTALYAAAVRNGRVLLRTGVRRLIEECRRAGMRLAIATTTSAGNVVELLAGTLGGDSPGWFDCIVAGDAVHAKKPAPDVYQEALRRLRLPAHACLAIEDSAPGLQSALAAGLATLITTSTYTAQHDFTGALAVLDHLGDPQQPFHVRDGIRPATACIDLPLLRRWHEAGCRQAEIPFPPTHRSAAPRSAPSGG